MKLSRSPSGQLSAQQTTSSAAGLIVAGLLVFLIILAASHVAKETHKAVKGLGLWALSLERTRKVGKYIYLFALLLLVVRAFKGIGGVVKVLAAVMCLPFIFAKNIWVEFLKRTPGRVRQNTTFVRIVFLFVEKRNREHLIGDLEEEYCAFIVPARSPFRARCWWWYQLMGIMIAYLWKRTRRMLDRTATPRLRHR
jgi:hypothetical protein